MDQESAPPENLFPAGGLEDEESLNRFSFYFEADKTPRIAAHSAHEGQRGLLLYKYYFTLDAENLPLLDVSKEYRISFWARRLGFDETRTPAMLIYNAIPLENAGGSNPAQVNAGGSNPVQVPVTSTAWKTHELVFMPKEPQQLYVEFWIHTDTENMVDIDDIRIEEIN
jgi:hypothetical protein